MGVDHGVPAGVLSQRTTVAGSMQAIAAATRAGAGQPRDRGADERRRYGAWGYGAVQGPVHEVSKLAGRLGVAGRGIRAIWTMRPPQHGQSSSERPVSWW